MEPGKTYHGQKIGQVIDGTTKKAVLDALGEEGKEILELILQDTVPVGGFSNVIIEGLGSWKIKIDGGSERKPLTITVMNPSVLS